MKADPPATHLVLMVAVAMLVTTGPYYEKSTWIIMSESTGQNNYMKSISLGDAFINF